ncbi:hypothetical protein HK102_008523, partial [Quaeritorhiza haematococci]
MRWSLLPSTSPAPPPGRFGHTSTMIGKYMVVAFGVTGAGGGEGGGEGGMVVDGGVYLFDVVEGRWVESYEPPVEVLSAVGANGLAPETGAGDNTNPSSNSNSNSNNNSQQSSSNSNSSTDAAAGASAGGASAGGSGNGGNANKTVAIAAFIFAALITISCTSIICITIRRRRKHQAAHQSDQKENPHLLSGRDSFSQHSLSSGGGTTKSRGGAFRGSGTGAGKGSGEKGGEKSGGVGGMVITGPLNLRESLFGPSPADEWHPSVAGTKNNPRDNDNPKGKGDSIFKRGWIRASQFRSTDDNASIMGALDDDVETPRRGEGKGRGWGGDKSDKDTGFSWIFPASTPTHTTTTTPVPTRAITPAPQFAKNGKDNEEWNGSSHWTVTLDRSPSHGELSPGREARTPSTWGWTGFGLGRVNSVLSTTTTTHPHNPAHAHAPARRVSTLSKAESASGRERNAWSFFGSLFTNPTKKRVSFNFEPTTNTYTHGEHDHDSLPHPQTHLPTTTTTTSFTATPSTRNMSIRTSISSSSSSRGLRRVVPPEPLSPGTTSPSTSPAPAPTPIPGMTLLQPPPQTSGAFPPRLTIPTPHSTTQGGYAYTYTPYTHSSTPTTYAYTPSTPSTYAPGQGTGYARQYQQQQQQQYQYAYAS